MVVAALMISASAMAQIPANIMDVLNKCDQKMDDPNGMIIDMTLKTKILVLSLNGTMRMYEKGDKSFCEVNIKALGKEMRTEQGFDGQQNWEFEAALSKKERDTLTITKGAQKKKEKFSVDMGLDKEYKKAKLKTTDKFYEITFTGPLTKDMPKKSIIRIVKDTYMLHQYETKVSIASMKMTVTKIKLGLSDNIFTFDPKKYPNAVVVRK
jgi:hypothetical protein